MKMRTTRTLLLVAGLAGLAILNSALADAPQYGTIPYKILFDAQQKADALRDLDHLDVGMAVGSTQAGVKKQDITLTIQDKAGPIVMVVDKEGRFTLPITPELQAENPDVVSNQPKGTLNLTSDITIRNPRSTSLRYSDLMAGAEQFNVAIKRQAGMLSWFAPHVDGILLLYKSGGSHHVVIGEGGDAKTIAGVPLSSLKDKLKHLSIEESDAGTTAILLETDKDLLKEDPQVTLDALPAGVAPLM